MSWDVNSIIRIKMLNLSRVLLFLVPCPPRGSSSLFFDLLDILLCCCCKVICYCYLVIWLFSICYGFGVVELDEFDLHAITIM